MDLSKPGIYIHLILLVKPRNNFIRPEWNQSLCGQISTVLKTSRYKVLAINGMPDHLHILLDMNASYSIDSLANQTKQTGSDWISNYGDANSQFEWQEAYAAFSCSQYQVTDLCRYIGDQQAYHVSVTFKEEFISFLKELAIEYNEEELPEFYN